MTEQRARLPTRDEFAGCQGSTFVLVSSDEHQETLTLIDVEEIRRQGDIEQFSVFFRSERMEHLAQRSYRLEHEQLGNFELFLVPLGPDDRGMRYQAVFS